MKPRMGGNWKYSPRLLEDWIRDHPRMEMRQRGSTGVDHRFSMNGKKRSLRDYLKIGKIGFGTINGWK
jgi:hypothetical protein